MADKIFAEGLYVDRRDTAPDFVVCRLGIDRDRFVAWLNRQPVSERGYLNINVTTSQRDPSKMVAALDTWRPKDSPVADRVRQSTPALDAMDDDIPFAPHEKGWLA